MNLDRETTLFVSLTYMWSSYSSLQPLLSTSICSTKYYKCHLKQSESVMSNETNLAKFIVIEHFQSLKSDSIVIIFTFDIIPWKSYRNWIIIIYTLSRKLYCETNSSHNNSREMELYVLVHIESWNYIQFRLMTRASLPLNMNIPLTYNRYYLWTFQQNICDCSGRASSMSRRRHLNTQKLHQTPRSFSI